MFEKTQIPPEKIAAYLRTTYRLDFPSNPIHLKVGEFSIELENIFKSKHIHCAAFITAYNPQGTQVSNQKILSLIRGYLMRLKSYRLNS